MSEVLLVSDIVDHIPHYETALRAHGYGVVVATSVSAALARAIAGSPTCIVIDERVSEMTGWDLCRRMRADLRIRSIPIVMLVKDLAPGTTAAVPRDGCSSWLAQPATAEHLVRAIEHVLSQDDVIPPTDRDAVLGLRKCVACQSDQTRPGVRIGAVQYYFCRSCGLYWDADRSAS